MKILHTQLFVFFYISCFQASLSMRYKKNEPYRTRSSFWFAEREGFEPPEPLSSTVFKTAAIDHSAISPLLIRANCAQDETRTHTVLRPLPPQSSVYTNFTTCALCPKQDSNLHVSQHSHLKRARLPIPPFGRCVSDIESTADSILYSKTFLEKQSRNRVLLISIERQTRLELATPTLARLCSTN